jgi:NADH:ubiquinone oxidoreductase subunit 4 (subunit M)
MLTPIVLLSCWKIEIVLSKSFVIYLLIIQILSLAVFIVLDLLLFYINFESVLIPMFFLIAFWGSLLSDMNEFIRISLMFNFTDWACRAFF